MKTTVFAILSVCVASSAILAMYPAKDNVTMAQLGTDINEVIAGITSGSQDLKMLLEKVYYIQEVAKNNRGKYLDASYFENDNKRLRTAFAKAGEMCNEVVLAMSDLRIKLFALKNDSANNQQCIASVQSSLSKSAEYIAKIQALKHTKETK
jgi:hypothetical protein